jgi:hypothetical protein
MAKKKETDYRSGSALLKKQLAERAGKPVGLPSKKNVINAAKQIGGAALLIAGPGKAVKGAQAGAKAVVKAVAKRQGKKEVANTKKAVRYVAEKVQTKTIAENSVKVRRGNPSEAKRMNEFSNKRTQDIASGKRAKSEEASVKNMKPAKVVKINSGTAKTASKKPGKQL